jgi:kinesin family protein C2/C3
MAIPVKTMKDVHNLWEECLSQRAARLMEQGADFQEYEATSHVIVTVNVISTNIATGVGTVGKIQFVDLAGSDLVPKRPVVGGAKGSKNTASDGLLAGVGNNSEWKFANKSLATLSDVVSARCQFMRSVPYRNSTLTHLLRDSIEADTKVLLVVCVSSDPKNLQVSPQFMQCADYPNSVSVVALK